MQSSHPCGKKESCTGHPSLTLPSCAGTADLSGQYIAAFASTAMVWQQTYPNDTSGYYDTLMTAALELYGAAVAVPGRCASSLADRVKLK